MFIEENSILLFSFYERTLHLFNANTQKFISDRSVFVNSEWVLPWSETIPHWDEQKIPPKIICYSAAAKEEILQPIEIDKHFRCIVIKKGEEFGKYSNVLFHQEYYSTIDEEDYEYYLGFTNKDDFLNNSLFNIKKKFSVTVKG